MKNWKNLASKVACCTAILLSGTLVLVAQNSIDIKPTPQQTAWQDLEFGVIVHFGTNTFLNREWGDGTASPQTFNPKQLDTVQWMRAIKASGAKYVVMVAKHHDGFCLWPTAQTSYSVKSSPWKNGKGDLIREAAEAARAEGLRFGVYLSPWDRHEPKYRENAAYDAYYRAELEELASHYGDLVELWLDGAGSNGHVYDFPKIIETLRTYQPNTIVFADTALFEYGDARWAGDETGRIDYENWNVIDRHGYLRWRPVEVDTPLRKLHWFWHPSDESSLKTVPELMRSYEGAVGHGGQWMIGVAPDDRGLLPDADVSRLREIGEAIQKSYGPASNLALHATPLDPSAKSAIDGDPDTFWSASKGTHSATLELHWQQPQKFDRTQTMEWLVEGQQIQRYRIEAWVGGGWKTLVSGQALGHKKIDRFPVVTSNRVRLHILTSAGTASIREFSVYAPETP